MKIVFASAQKNSPSYIFYSANFSQINQLTDGVRLDIQDDPKTVDYAAYDVALFMGFDQQASLAKEKNPSILVGVVEPRGSQRNTFEDVDFIVANGMESKDYFSKFNHNIVLYYDYPEVPEKQDCAIEKKGLVLGYHGNRVHLEEMIPRITTAISMLAKEMPLELWAMYNIQKLGKWAPSTHLGFPVVHVQYSEENYAKYMAHVDIGIVPQFISRRNHGLLYILFDTLDQRLNANNSNYDLRFKETTNIGRHLVFAQYSIPVVSDMTPSASAFIEDEKDGFIASHGGGWFRSLKKLASNEDLRRQMGRDLHAKYKKQASVELLNKRLLSFIEALPQYKQL